MPVTAAVRAERLVAMIRRPGRLSRGQHRHGRDAATHAPEDSLGLVDQAGALQRFDDSEVGDRLEVTTATPCALAQVDGGSEGQLQWAAVVRGLLRHGFGLGHLRDGLNQLLTETGDTRPLPSS